MNRITETLIRAAMPRFGFTIVKRTGEIPHYAREGSYMVSLNGIPIVESLTESDALDAIGTRILPMLEREFDNG